MRNIHGRFLTGVAIAGVVLAGCADGDPVTAPSPTPTATSTSTPSPSATPSPPAEPGALAVTATDAGDGSGYAFEAPATVAAGTYELSLSNTGMEGHHAQLYRLNDDKTMADFAAAGQSEDAEAAMLGIGIFGGGTGSVDPGGTSQANAIVDLDAGTWIFLCFIPAADGAPHLAKGMVQPMTVEASSDPFVEVAASASVGLVDFSFSTPGTFSTGSVVEFTNESQAEAHEGNLLALADGATAQDVLAFFQDPEPSGPPPFSSAAGVQALMPGASQKLQLNLSPGDYAFVCFVPSPANEGTPHAFLGMISEITVT